MKRFFSVLLLGALTACSSSLAQTDRSPVRSNAKNQVSSNLVGLFLVKKDNLKNQFRGEIYPIALYVNGNYIDVSNDVTQEIRDNFQEEFLLKTVQSRSFLSAFKNFTVTDQDQKIGEFSVNQPTVSQFACTSMITGQGEFSGNVQLPQVFDSIPNDRAGGFNGSIGKKKFDETWRWAIAASHYTPTRSASPKPTQAEVNRYNQDLLSTAKTLIAQSPEAQKSAVSGVEALANLTVLDLNHDGRAEVFGIVRKGSDPKSASAPPQPTVHVNLWLDYSNGEPRVMSSQVQVAQVSNKPPYDLAGTLDVNGDGIEEAIVKTNGYESSSFGIYEYRNNQLNEVFNGAGYGC